MALILIKQPDYCLSGEFGCSIGCTGCPLNNRELCEGFYSEKGYSNIRAYAYKFLVDHECYTEILEELL